MDGFNDVAAGPLNGPSVELDVLAVVSHEAPAVPRTWPGNQAKLDSLKKESDAKVKAVEDQIASACCHIVSPCCAPAHTAARTLRRPRQGLSVPS